MDRLIHDQVLAALKAEFSFKKTGGDWLQQGKCPSCGERELFIHAVTPKVLKCGRTNNCSFEQSVRSYFPEIFENWSDRYKQSDEAPNAAADAYLRDARGLDISKMKGWYSQESFTDKNTNHTTATIRFPLPNDSWWERLIDLPGRFEKKANFKWGGSWGGWWWIPNDVDYGNLAKADHIVIAEGIFDAIALNSFFATSEKHKDGRYIAVSNMSVNVWPEHSLAEVKKHINGGHTPGLIWAFDVGAAGVKFTRKFNEQAIEANWASTAAQVRPDGEGGKHDWNDLWFESKLTDESFEDYLLNGKITIARNSTEKAVLLFMRNDRLKFWMLFNGRTYWVEFDKTKLWKLTNEGDDGKGDVLTQEEALPQCCQITQIANCSWRTLYRERDEGIDETNYFMQINFPRINRPVKARFTNGALSSPADFKKRLLAFGGMFTGTGYQLDRMVEAQTTGLKTVEPIGFFGYSPDHRAWLFPKHAVHQGRLVKLNSEDYFDFGNKAAKLRSAEAMMSIDWDKDKIDLSWVPVIWAAWRENGIIALAFWVQSYFAVQIRNKQKSLPFMEFIGLPGSGKSTIIEFLWKLSGREYEGFDPAKATPAAVARNFNKASNLPVVLLEADRDKETPHNRRFNFDELKDLFNGRAFRPRAIKNSGNETMEEPFRGTIVVAQNEPVDASDAILERIMRLHFDKSGWSPVTKEAAFKIENWSMAKVSGFIIHCCLREKQYLAAYQESFDRNLAAIGKRPDMKNGRLIKNHAQLAASLDALRTIVNIPDGQTKECHDFIISMCLKREDAVRADHPVVSDFWEKYYWLLSRENPQFEGSINSSQKPEQIAINLTHFEQRCRSVQLIPPKTSDLKKHLRTSRSHKFVSVKTVNAGGSDRLHCWVFENPDHIKRSA